MAANNFQRSMRGYSALFWELWELWC